MHSPPRSGVTSPFLSFTAVTTPAGAMNQLDMGILGGSKSTSEGASSEAALSGGGTSTEAEMAGTPCGSPKQVTCCMQDEGGSKGEDNQTLDSAPHAFAKGCPS